MSVGQCVRAEHDLFVAHSCLLSVEVAEIREPPEVPLQTPDDDTAGVGSKQASVPVFER